MTKKLSICMIVKDEANNLRRCLDSLRPLSNRKDTELIIVDTGSSDNTVEIAKGYTKNVYFHKWNGHFSDMRNKSLAYATGDWIFIIDADEELVDANNLIQLLESDTLQQYNTVQIKVDNIIYSNKSRIIHHIGERIFRNDGYFKYNGSIHNQPQFKYPIYLANVTLNHYGYMNDDEELMEKKFKRTATMLLDELSKDPNHIYYRFQLARSYFMHKDYYEAYDQIKLAYDTMKKLFHNKEIPSDLYYIFVEYARISFVVKKFEETLKVAEEGLTLNENYIDFYFYIGYAAFNLKRDDKGEYALSQYFSLYTKYKNNEINLSQYTTVELFSFDDGTKESVAYKYVNHLIKVKKFTEADKFVDFIDNDRYKFECLIKIIIGKKEYEQLVIKFNQLNSQSKLVFIELLENIKKDCEIDVVRNISLAFSKNNESSYSLFNKICINENSEISLIKKFFAETSIEQLPIFIFSEVFNVLLLNEPRIFLKQLKDYDSLYIKKIVVELIEKYLSEDKLVEILINEGFKYSSVDMQKVKYVVSSVLLLNYENNKTPDNTFKKIFEIFIYEGKQYVLNVYQPQKLRIIYKTLDNSSFEKLFMLMILFEQTKEKNFKSALEYYKEAVDLYPYFSIYLNEEIQKVRSELDIQNIIKIIDETSSLNNELKILHGTVEIAGQLNTLVRGLNQLDKVKAIGLDYYPNYLSYGNINTVDISKIKDKDKVTNEILEAALNTFDVFHFHFNTSLKHDLSDLPLLKESNKKIFMHNWGTDVRLLSIAKHLNPNAKTKNEDEKAIMQYMQYLASYIDDCIVADAELYEYVKGFYTRVHFVRQALDLNQYLPNINFEFRKTKPVIVHAPTSTDFKGTKTIHAVIEKLKLKYDFEYRLVQNLSHEEAKAVYRDADIIIDQLHSVGHGMLALEGMAMGKPVITSISEFMAEYYPKEIPIISANPDNLEKKVEHLIKDWEMRESLGKQGRMYVEKYHDHRKIANELLGIYTS